MQRLQPNGLDTNMPNRDAIQKIATFQTLASGIIGKQEFVDVALFFGSIIKKCMDYEIKRCLLCFITRRCHVLWGIFYDYFVACKESTISLDLSDSPIFEEGSVTTNG